MEHIENSITGYLFVVLIGLSIGSFLNVVIHRLPRMMERRWKAMAFDILGIPCPTNEYYDLAWPASHCPKCRHSLSAWENIPLFSWLMLKGQCRECHAPISIRYPMVEALSAIILLWLWVSKGMTWDTLFLACYAWILIAIFFIDWDTLLIPDELSLSLLWIGLIFNALMHHVSTESMIFGATMGYMIPWMFNRGFLWVKKRNGMGNGDFKLFAAMGAWWGIESLPWVFLMASCFGLVLYVILHKLNQVKHTEHGAVIPFGPAIVLSGLVILVQRVGW